jgi:hypothetical protein
MLFTEPTDVQPNFNTFISELRLVLGAPQQPGCYSIRGANLVRIILMTKGLGHKNGLKKAVRRGNRCDLYRESTRLVP